MVDRLDVVEQVPITATEAKHELSKIKKRDEELNFRANKTEEYLNHFKLLKVSDVKSIKEKLKALDISRLRDEHLVKIIDILPESVDDLKIVLSGFSITLPKESLEKIVSVVKEFV